MRKAISLVVKLQVVLRYLASGDSISSLQYLYRVPKNTISSFLEEVLDAISLKLKDYIQVMRNWVLVIVITIFANVLHRLLVGH